MNAKKIIKGIVKLGVMGGIAYAAYKLGECNGEVNERMREKYGDEDEDEDASALTMMRRKRTTTTALALSLSM